MFVQINSENKFLGSLLWKIADFLTFGAFESKSKPEEVKIEKKEDDDEIKVAPVAVVELTDEQKQ
jgi:hypothetical protein